MFHTIFSLRCLPPVEVAPSPRRTSDFGLRTSDSAWSRSGSALVIVLGMLSVLLLMGVAFSVTMRTERAAAANMRHAAVARHILDSALARTMADLDRALEDQGDLPVPTGGVIVTVSQQPGGEASVNPLSPEAALHIPADQLVAAVFTNAQWLPIYGDVRINGNNANDPVRDDSPVGRYAFVVLNGCGYLDPNVVGASNRLYGLSPCEIDITGEGGRVLGITGAGKADKFLEERDSEGHFVTMRDFLRPTVTNLLGYKPMNIDGANLRFPTNSFFVGSLALDDLAPPTGTDSNGYPIRKPKFSLRDPDTGELKKASKLKDDPAFLEAMTNSFLATYAGQKKNPLSNKNGYLSEKFFDPFNSNKKFDYSLLVARNLLDMMDEDGCPGGGESKKHSFSSIGQQNSANEDEYLAAFGVHNWNWDRLPCVEPVPLLDGLAIIGGYGDDPADWTPTFLYETDRLKTDNGDGTTTLGAITNIKFTISLTVAAGAFYPGKNLPEGADGEYTGHWRIFFSSDSTSLDSQNEDNIGVDKYKPFFQSLRNALSGYEDVDFAFPVERHGDEPNTPRLGDYKKLSKNIEFSISVNPEDGLEPATLNQKMTDYIPSDFGFILHGIGVMGRGDKDSSKNDVVQVVPCQQTSFPSSYDDSNPSSYLDVYIKIRQSAAVEKGSDYAQAIQDKNLVPLPVLGAVYAVDPRFAFKWGSWLWTPGRNELDNFPDEPYVKLGSAMTKNGETRDDLAILGNAAINPLTQLYLTNPTKDYGGTTHFDLLCDFEGNFGGVGDEMRTRPDSQTISGHTAEEVASTVFFDPSASEDSPWAFTRVGQLGFVPIGTFRTIALMDGFDNVDDNHPHVEVRQRVLDYFTMNPPRDEGSSGSDSNPGDPVKTELFTSRVGINPPRFPEVNSDNEVVPGDYNLLPLTAAFNGCPLREWDNSAPTVDWDTAAALAELIADSLDRDDEGVRNADKISKWDDAFDDAEGVTRSLSVLGRSVYDSDVEKCFSIDKELREKFSTLTANDREGVIRNTAEMLTTRQQLFTILLKADSYTPMSGFSDASHGMSLASVQVIAHIWRDPEPLRDADGRVILDDADRPIHAWMLLDMYQF